MYAFLICGHLVTCWCILLAVINTRNMDWNIEKRCITWLLFVLNGLHIFDAYFQMHVMSKWCPRVFEFLYMRCFVIGLHWIQIWWELFEGNRRCGINIYKCGGYFSDLFIQCFFIFWIFSFFILFSKSILVSSISNLITLT